jgi:hypothetical protein
MSVRKIIRDLNSLAVGELERILSHLDDARSAVRHREDLADVAESLEEARQAITSGDLRTYRKRIERAVSRLGHARS